MISWCVLLRYFFLQNCHLFRMQPIWDAEKAALKAKANREELITLAHATGVKVINMASYNVLLEFAFFWPSKLYQLGIWGIVNYHPCKSHCKMRSKVKPMKAIFLSDNFIFFCLTFFPENRTNVIMSEFQVCSVMPPTLSLASSALCYFVFH